MAMPLGPPRPSEGLTSTPSSEPAIGLSRGGAAAPSSETLARPQAVSPASAAGPQGAQDVRLCAGHCRQAARLEAAALAADAEGRTAEAIKQYTLAATELEAAAEGCPPWHRDKREILAHVEDLQDRCKYLGGLCGSRATLPPEQHIAPRLLSVGDQQGDEGAGVLGFVSLAGCVAGLATSGPLAALVLAAGVAHAACRDDAAGLLARRVGRGGADICRRLPGALRAGDTKALLEIVAGDGDTSRRAEQALKRARRRLATQLQNLESARWEVLSRLGQGMFLLRWAVLEARDAVVEAADRQRP